MRYVLAAIFVSAVSATASALPMVTAYAVWQSKSDASLQVAKRSHPAGHSHAHHNRGDGGIHPLVGSGAY